MESKNSKVSIIVLAKGDISIKKKSIQLRQLHTDYIVYYRNKIINLNPINMYAIYSKTFRAVR